MDNIRINEFFMDNAWKWKCNLPEIDYDKRDKLAPKSQISEFDDLPEEFNEILKAADNRMHQGKFRYGPIKRQNLSNYDTVKECIRRMQRYIDGDRQNLELVVDAFNMCRIEFYKGKLAGKTIQSVDDGEHAQEIIKQ